MISSVRTYQSLTAWMLLLAFGSGTARAAIGESGADVRALEPAMTISEAATLAVAALPQDAASAAREETLLREMKAREADRDRRRRAAIGKKVSGYFIVLTGLAGSAGLAKLTVDKQREEERKGVAEEDRVAPLYGTGAVFTGLIGLIWGLRRVKTANSELQAINNERIQITASMSGDFGVRVRFGF